MRSERQRVHFMEFQLLRDLGTRKNFRLVGGGRPEEAQGAQECCLFLCFFWFLLPLSFTYARSVGWVMGFDDESSDGARPACLVVKCLSFFGFPPGSQHLRILIHDRRHLGFLIQIVLSNLCSLLESCIAFHRPV